eukprot:1153263-Pelagomonas_calceolata.AAC.7
MSPFCALAKIQPSFQDLNHGPPLRTWVQRARTTSYGFDSLLITEVKKGGLTRDASRRFPRTRIVPIAT